VDATLRNWFISIDVVKREKLVEGFWKVVEASGADNTDDLFTFKSTFNMMKSMGKIDDETKEIMSEGIKLFMKAIRKMTKDNREVRKENRRRRRLKEGEVGKLKEIEVHRGSDEIPK
jgi:vacuolar-type H+-ATPase catalytic subunit A/Vma1